MNDSPTLLSLKGEFNNLALLVPINVSGGVASAQIHLVSFISGITIWEMDVSQWPVHFMSTSHKQQTTMTICTASLILHSPCCLDWSISSPSRPGLGPNAAADFHTLRWVKREFMMVMLLKRLLIEFSLTICKMTCYRRSSLPAAIRLCNRTQ